MTKMNPCDASNGKEETSHLNGHRSLATRRVAYSVAAAAAGAAASDAQAAIVYSGVQDINIAPFAAQNINLDGDAYQDILLKNYVFGFGNYQGAYVNYGPGGVVGFISGFAYASALVDDDLIDVTTVPQAPNSIFEVSLAYGANNPNAEFNNTSAATGEYIGLAFPINATLHYGWVRVTIDNALGIFVVNDWAYDDVPGAGILAGDTGVTAGDFNGDGVVDGADYAFLRNGLDVDPEPAGTGDGSGTLDAGDLPFYVNNFGAGAAPAAATAPVPEPATLGLLAAGSLGLTTLRRRRTAAIRQQTSK